MHSVKPLPIGRLATCAIIAGVPWGLLMLPFGIPAQLIGLGVQAVGLAGIIIIGVRYTGGR